MARLLVQLKLRLMRNALRASTAAKAAFITSTILAVLVAAGVFTGLALLRGQSAAVDLTTVIFTLFAFAWLILPLVVFGLDTTLDPATLALYPLRTRPLAVGLLAASATGPWPAATLIGLLGVTVGLARGPAGLIIAVLAVLLQVLFCLTLARFVTTGLAGVLRSRRGKDFAALLIIPIFALYEGFVQIVPKLTAEGKLTAGSFDGIDSWLRWIPPGLAAHSIQDASDGHLGTALLRLVPLAAIIVVLGALSLTNNVVEAMRRAKVKQLFYASGSGVYGDAGDATLAEDYAPLRPVSTYGASKLAGEALIASYCSMFGLRACAFRFGNVVGARQTHGVGYDFLRRLTSRPCRLRILGDGHQSKPYIHVSDIVAAVLCAAQKATGTFSVFNVATDDAVTVTEIADLAVETLGLPARPVFEYAGGRCGWRGDVPVLRLDSTRMRSLGWVPKWNSRQAVRHSLQELLVDERSFRN